MKISIRGPFAELSGTYDGSDLVYARNSFTGTTYAYGKESRPDPETCDQLLVRRIGAAAARHWQSLTAPQRDAWNRYAAVIGSQAKPRRGFDICREAARMRLLIGLEPRADAPVYPAPGPVMGLALEPAADPKTFSFRVDHAVESPAACRLVVKVTPATASVAAKPRPRAALCICGYRPASSAPLPDSGGLVSIAGARVGVEPGARFGIALTVIRVEDGLASNPSFHDLVRT